MKRINLLKGLFATTLVTTPMVVLTSCKDKETIYAAIEVTSQKDSVSVTQTLQMGITVSPSSVSDKPKVNWSVDDTSCATINSNGLLTALKVGKVTVTAVLDANSKVKASKTIDIVNYLITPTISCSQNMSATAEPFILGDNLVIKYSFDKEKIDIDKTNIKVNGQILETEYTQYTIDEDSQTLTINGSLFTTSKQANVELTTTNSLKIIPTVTTSTGLKQCTCNSVEGGKTLTINYNTESDYGIATINDISATIKYSDESVTTRNALSIDKKNKIIKIVIPVANDDITVASVTVSINTCELWDQVSAIDYIYNRTFSFNAGANFGTLWILNPYDSTELSSYQYYIATNWHVKYQLISACSDFKIGNGKDATVTNYQTIRVIDWCDEEKMTYDGTINKAVDLAVALVDLSNAANNDAAIKTQLDNLNTYYEQHGYITQIADATSSTKHYESKKLYTAGFPIQAAANPKWETHSYEANEFEYCDWNSPHCGHSWELGQGKYASDISPMYGLIDKCVYSTMAGGSSGSMMIANFGTDEHPYFKVIAIYWGGWLSDPGTTADKHLSFSIFNNDKKNFLKDYI